ncbi:4Fe-4S dicluster domain-containing protein, partial [Jannaschia sp.]|nr:4Fe-4S dicluster domain-containing protein [Jannaschia sp.]
MTSLPNTVQKKLGLVIDLDTCVGCHACVTACKGWNTQNYGAPLSDQNPYGDASGTFLNRIHSFQVQPDPALADHVPPRLTQTVHFPKSCLHCDDAPCVTVCPTGASYKRAE